MTDILILTHSEDSTAGTVPDWCQSQNLNFEVATAEDIVSRAEPPSFKGLIVCGGDMEAWQDDRHPWLKGEKQLIKQAIASKTPVFGICLGSQLLAEQLGAKLEPMGLWELGWFPVNFKGQTMTPFHCHSSRFNPFSDAAITAENEHHPHQAFESGTYRGVQFHIEIDETRMKHILNNVKIPDEGFVQPKSEFMRSFGQHREDLKDFCFDQLTSWWHSREPLQA